MTQLSFARSAELHRLAIEAALRACDAPGEPAVTMARAALYLAEYAARLETALGGRVEPPWSQRRIACVECGGAFEWDHRITPPSRCFRCAVAREVSA
jgi:hypothetical protein